ncbi:MAG: nuclear transport factor 2 family protein [Chitinophagaceae bacterium]|nr:MAG: nuclear transport factor 2 family protein [Chitinophagaceae bacterium]
MRKFRLLILVLLIGISCVQAQTKDEKLVAESVERLRKAMIDPDKTTLEKLTSPKLSYGHSNGLIEDRATFVQALVSAKSDFTDIKLREQTITVSGNTAIVRHFLDGTTNDGGRAGTVKLAVLLVWNQKGTSWQLLARQAVKITQ